MNDPVLEGVSHVVIDEVHERDIDTDFLLVLLKELLTNRPELRLLLMSATLDAESFGTYFSRDRETELNKPVPVMTVPAKPFHPVHVIHLEDISGESYESSSLEDDDIPTEIRKLAKSLLEAHDQQLQLDLDEADAEERASARLEARSSAEDDGAMLDRSDSESSESDRSDSDSSESEHEHSDSESDSDDESSYTGLERLRTRAETLRRAVSMRNAATGKSSRVVPRSR
jgi:hypothetical protein